MKKLSLSFLAIALVALTISCKKEKSPELEVTVVNDNNEPIRKVWIKASVDGANAGILNGEVLDSSRTDDFGKAFFTFKNTVLIDIALYNTDGTGPIIDSASVLLETKRLRGKSENKTEKKLVFR